MKETISIDKKGICLNKTWLLCVVIYEIPELENLQSHYLDKPELNVRYIKFNDFHRDEYGIEKTSRSGMLMVTNFGAN